MAASEISWHTEAGEAASGTVCRLVSQIALREVVRTCDFQAKVTWVSGVLGEIEYIPRVFTKPSRWVIDVAH